MEALKSQGDKVLTVLPWGASKLPDAEYNTLVLYTVGCHECLWFPPLGPNFPTKPSDREAFADFCKNLPRLAGEINVPAIVAMEGGSHSIMNRIGKLRQGTVSAKMLVVGF